jgi:hypothetical protein
MAENVLVRPLAEIDTELALAVLLALVAGAEADVDDGDVVAVEPLVLELLLQAAASNAAETATAVSPALFADTEYNGVPRLFRSRHAHRACARSDPWGPISVDRALLVEMLDRRRETFLLTLP